MDITSFLARINQRLRTAAYSLKSDWSTLRLAYAVARIARVDPDRQPVIFFNASTRIRGHSLNAAFSLLTAWALRLQDVPVIHFVCARGMSHCLQGTDQEDVSRSMPCALCLRQSRVNFAGAVQEKFGYQVDPALSVALAGRNIDALMKYEQPFGETTLPLGQLVLPSIRWRLRRLTLPDDKPTRYLYREFILSAWSVLQQFDRLLHRVKEPQAVVLFNGQTFPEAVVRWLAVKRGLRVITHEVSMAPLSGFFTDGEATALPMPIPPDFELSPAQNARLDALMQSRFEGKVTMAGIHFFPEMKGLDAGFLQKAAGFKQIVPVFTNVIFDTTQQHSNAFFPDMFAWLDAVLQVIRRNPETLFVLRAHPDEARPGKVSRESVAMWVERTGAAKLPNLVFVAPVEYISSYELIRRSKFVMVYASTIGLEASIMGKPVLSAGSARFSHFNTMVFPASREEYLSRLEEFLSAGEVKALSEHARNARRFFYFHNYRASLPFGEFVEPAWLRGFVKWKKFSLRSLSPEASPTIRTLLDGILQGGDFMLEDTGP